MTKGSRVESVYAPYGSHISGTVTEVAAPGYFVEWDHMRGRSQHCYRRHEIRELPALHQLAEAAK